ncbi:MAG: hypothetical protein DYG92_01735 [Leptolyngbya sp. PLA1]|nr:hypothetical protein [Leptolyngbya sp. PLA1]
MPWLALFPEASSPRAFTPPVSLAPAPTGGYSSRMWSRESWEREMAQISAASTTSGRASQTANATLLLRMGISTG